MIVLCDEVTCVVCGHTGQFPSIGHWEAEGPWGLDGRPPEPLISHLELLVQTCPDCGYSADFVGLAAPGVAADRSKRCLPSLAPEWRNFTGWVGLLASGAYCRISGGDHQCGLVAHPCRLAIRTLRERSSFPRSSTACGQPPETCSVGQHGCM